MVEAVQSGFDGGGGAGAASALPVRYTRLRVCPRSTNGSISSPIPAPGSLTVGRRNIGREHDEPEDAPARRKDHRREVRERSAFGRIVKSIKVTCKASSNRMAARGDVRYCSLRRASKTGKVKVTTYGSKNIKVKVTIVSKPAVVGGEVLRWTKTWSVK